MREPLEQARSKSFTTAIDVVVVPDDPSLDFGPAGTLSIVARYAGSFQPAPVLEADADTSALWRLDEGAGTAALDASDNGNDGVIQGPVWASAPCCPGMIEP